MFIKVIPKIMTEEHIARQFFLSREADIDYMCYYLKITPWEFWEEYLWNYFGIFNEREEEVESINIE